MESSDRVPTLTSDILTRSGLIGKYDVDDELQVLRCNLNVLRKVANDYPLGTFSFLNHVIDTQQWHLLRLLESKTVFSHKDIPFDKLTGRAPMDTSFINEISQADLIYALVGMIDIDNSYGDVYHVDTNLRLCSNNYRIIEGLFIRINAYYIANQPFCICTGDYTQDVRDNKETLLLFWGEGTIDGIRNYVRLRSLLMGCSKEQLALHRLPDGSSFPCLCDGETFIRELILRFNLYNDEMTREAIEYYLTAITRRAGLDESYVPLVRQLQGIKLRDMSPQTIIRELEKIGEAIDRREQGHSFEYYFDMLFNAVALLRPNKYHVLYEAGIRVTVVDGTSYRVDLEKEGRTVMGFSFIISADDPAPMRLAAISVASLQEKEKGNDKKDEDKGKEKEGEK